MIVLKNLTIPCPSVVTKQQRFINNKSIEEEKFKMPGYDRTGPRGQGSMSGRGQGPCAGSGENIRPRFGSFGGFGRGWRNRFFASGHPGRFWGRGQAMYESDFSSKEEVEILQNEANYFEKELKNIREEINRLKKDDKKENNS